MDAGSGGHRPDVPCVRHQKQPKHFGRHPSATRQPSTGQLIGSGRDHFSTNEHMAAQTTSDFHTERTSSLVLAVHPTWPVRVRRKASHGPSAVRVRAGHYPQFDTVSSRRVAIRGLPVLQRNITRPMTPTTSEVVTSWGKPEYHYLTSRSLYPPGRLYPAGQGMRKSITRPPSS